MEEKERHTQTRHKLKYSKRLRGTLSALANTKGDLNELEEKSCSGLGTQH